MTSLGQPGRYEILLRTVSSGLPYVSVIGSWRNRDGAEALMEVWFRGEYGPNYEVQWAGSTLVATGYPDKGEQNLVASAWVWENPDIKELE